MQKPGPWRLRAFVLARFVYLSTVNENVVVLVVVPLVPVMVIGYVPVFAVRATFSVKSDVPEPGAAMVAGLKLPVTPDGKPLAERATAPLNPPETVVVTTA